MREMEGKEKWRKKRKIYERNGGKKRKIYEINGGKKRKIYEINGGKKRKRNEKILKEEKDI